MSDFMNGFIKALSMPNSAEHLYEAGMALDKWLEERNRRQELLDVTKKNAGFDGGWSRSGMSDKDLFDPWHDRYRDDGRQDPRSGQPVSGGAGARGRDAELTPEGEREIDKMMLEVEDQLIDILNRGNPDPNAKKAGAPRRVPFFMRDSGKRRTLPGSNVPYRENP